MAPYFNAETGEMNPDSADLSTDHIAPAEPDRQAQEDRARRDRIGVGPQPAGDTDAPDPDKSPWLLLSPEFAGARYDEIRTAAVADPLHPLRDDRSPDHERAVAEYLGLQERMAGRNPDDPANPSNRVIGEQMAHTSILRPPGADALSPAPRPELPEGHAWDEAALVEAEQEAQAMDLPPHLVMTATDELAAMVEQEEQRGAGWIFEDGMAELTRWFGTEGAARVAANAQWALEAVAGSERSRLRQGILALADGRPNDPHLIRTLGVTLYEAFRSAPPSERLAALLERREHRLAQREAAARHAASLARAMGEEEADAVSEDALGQIWARHRRWVRP
jgi:hypothetical protein